jgi:hypothetical protein
MTIKKKGERNKVKFTRRERVFLSLLLIVSLAGWIGVFAFINRKDSGVASSISDLPIVGSDLSFIDCENVSYLFIPKRSVMYCKAFSDKEAFVKICKRYKLNFSESECDFPMYEFEGVDAFYVPTSEAVLFGYGFVQFPQDKELRTLMRVCWEPSTKTLYIYFFWR